MIKVTCHICNQELQEPGAILLTPPTKKNKVEKLHICVGCHDDMQFFINNQRAAFLGLLTK